MGCVPPDPPVDSSTLSASVSHFLQASRGLRNIFPFLVLYSRVIPSEKLLGFSGLYFCHVWVMITQALLLVDIKHCRHPQQIRRSLIIEADFPHVGGICELLGFCGPSQCVQMSSILCTEMRKIMKPENGQNKARPGLNDQITRILSRHLGAYNGCRVPSVAPWITCPLDVKMIASAKNGTDGIFVELVHVNGFLKLVGFDGPR